MNVLCSAVQVALPTVGLGAITGPLETHTESCSDCRHEIERYRFMYHELEALRAVEYRAPHDLVPVVMAGLGPAALADDEPRRDNRVPVAVGAVVATAAAGAVVLLRRHRQHAA